MKEIKTKERFENAFNAFFADESNEPNAMATTANTAIISGAAPLKFSQKADKYYEIFKKLFLFFPGVLMLHLASISYAIFYDAIGVNFWMLFWFASGSFMTWAGIGDLKNKRHLLIALPIILLGLTVGFSQSFFSSNAFQFLFAMILPLSFIAPILTKSAIDKFEENESGLTNRETVL